MHADGTNGESLKLTTRQEGDVTIHDVVEFKHLTNFLHVAERGTARKQSLDALLGAANGLGDLVDILGLDDGLEVIFQQLGEVVWMILDHGYIYSLNGFTHSATQIHGSA